MADILGINLSDETQTELVKRLDFFLMEEKSHFITTPNPEIILNAGHDEEYFFILNSADLSIADGFGLVIAGLLSGQKIHRTTGADLTNILLDKAHEKNLRILIINRVDGLSNKNEMEQALSKKWPKLNFKIIEIIKKESLSDIENKTINDFAPQIIFVGLGAPSQEKLIWHEIKNWPSSRIAIGIGGSFDFITGKTIRAPKIIRQIGLEWLWRLLSQPQNKLERLKRIWRATVVFMLKVINNYFIHTLVYRPNVACLLYKKDKDSGQYKILIVRRSDDITHWQLPQGGTDRQSIKEAGSRELREEIGTDKFVVRGVFKHVYKYKFFNTNKPAYRGYKGQKQGLLIAEFTGQDEDIKINYWDHSAWQWVAQEKIIETVHARRREGIKKFLEKFKEIVK
jgi:N-acetylglucosaminyldiphosphoundecaprenol N-acetyl-beta-D-mannosaminyltransferase